MMRQVTCKGIVLLCCTAVVALAVTVAELQMRLGELADDYEAVKVLVDNCPEGECPERPQIEADFAAAEAELALVHDDRATLDPCGNCGQLDSDIAAVDSFAGGLRTIINGWDDQS